jgi:hypothetical protein
MKHIKFNTQTDSEWQSEIMTQNLIPNWENKKWTDTLSRWGCLVSSFANIIQYYIDKKFTPKDLNDVLKTIKGYRYLTNPGCKESEASFIEWDKIIDYFQKSFKITLDAEQFRIDEKKRYIARVKHPVTGGGHYINILEKGRQEYWCFDVDDGRLKLYKEKEISQIHEFYYIGR